MKKIVQFFGRNFKGADFKHDLEAINLIVGRNFQNKTARLDAIQLALAGYHPACSRKVGDIFDSFSGAAPMLSCGVLFEDGFRVTRAYTQKAKGAVSYSDEYEGLTEGVKEWACSPVLIDHEAFLGLSARERSKLLFSMLAIKSDVTPESISAQVKNIKLEENTEHSEKAIAQVVAFINGVRSVSLTPQEWLESLSESAREAKKLADAATKRLAQTVLGLSATQGAVVNVNRPIETLIKKERDKLDAIARDGATLAEKLRVAQKSASRKIQIEGQLSSIKNNSEAITRRTTELADIDAKIVDLPPRDEASFAAEEARSERIKAENALRGLTDQRAKLKADFDKDMKRVDCPCCGAEGEDWKGKRSKKYDREDKKLANAIETLQANLVLMNERERVAKANLDEIDNVRVAQNELREGARKINADLNALKNEDAAIVNMRAELDAITIEDIDALQRQIEAKREEHRVQQPVVVQLEAEQKQIVAARADAASRARTVAEASLAAQVSLVWKATCEIIETKQRELITASIGGVIDSANELCEPILKTPIVYHDEDIGRFSGSKFIRHKTFSGTEKAITYSALCVALGARSSIRIAMIDELGRLDAENKAKLMKIIRKLIAADRLDQFVGIDVSQTSNFGSDVNLITV